MAKYKNFNYLDQLKNTTVDLSAYLEKWSTDDYEIKFSNEQPITATIANLFDQSDLIESFKNQGSSYVTYKVKDRQLIEDVAIEFYGSEDFWWVVAIFNDMNNPLTDWPKSEDQLNYLADIYSQYENRFSRDGYYQIIHDLNEENRIIQVLKPDHAYNMIDQFKSAIVNDNSGTNTFTITL